MASMAFGRLTDKTHSLLSLRGEGYRSRMDHTLRGVGITRTIARALRLNEDLAEAIAVGRSLGATAFAGAGSAALSLFTDEPFRHNHQSVRVVERIERRGEGLNLSWEVRDGIATHTLDSPSPATREGEVVRLGERIADLTGALTDGLAAGVVVTADLPGEIVRTWGTDPQHWARTLMADAVSASTETPEVRLTTGAWQALERLQTFVGDHIGERHGIAAERARGSHCLSSLVVFYLNNPARLPSQFRAFDDPTLIRVIDFVSSLSDGQALRLFNQLFLPRLSPHRL